MIRRRLVRSVLGGLALAATFAGCGESHTIVSAGVSNLCTRCHGGEGGDLTGAPPFDTHGVSTTTARGVGAHRAHLRAGYDCTACHVKPAPNDSSHSDGRVTLTWGGIATANGALSPQFVATSPARCASVYCHGSFTGGNAYQPEWNGTSGGQAACGTCHGSTTGTAAPPDHAAKKLAPDATNATCSTCHPETVDASGAIRAGGKHVNGAVDTDPAAKHPSGWTDPASADWHGITAAANPTACTRCHAVRHPATVSNVTCADCHAGGESWTTTCNGCHGEAGDPRGAPPADVRGRTAITEIGVGAHRRHVDPSVASGGLDCVFCHRKPADAYDPGHLDGEVTVTTYQGSDAAWIAAGRDPGWNRATATCSTSYCHSQYAPGNAPVWTAPRADACGTCHGLPPAGPHPAVGSDLTQCNLCHPATITPAGELIPPPDGKHLDGHVTVSGGHVSGWIDPASPEFHAYSADRGLSTCQFCHGDDLGGGFTGVACAGCHDASLPPGVASWKTNCVMCHGGGGGDTTGAPPRTLWGYGGDAVRVGAHRAHLAGGPLASPFPCATCHVVPADALAAGHVDPVQDGAAQPTATVTFSGVAAAGGTAPVWNRASRGCTVYCHGSAFDGTPAQGSHSTPDWTAGPSQATCGSCHGAPPGGAHPQRTDCGSCHAGYGDASVNLATHVNGILEPPAVDCSSCHGDRSRNATPLNPQLAASPPWGTDGEYATTERAVGAHQLHLNPGAGAVTSGIFCGECHVPVTSVAAANGHRNGTVDLAWGPIATTSIAAGAIQWDGSRCSGTYCHGNFPLGNASNAPTWIAPVASSCGTCHGIPPASPHPTNTKCGSCHDGYGQVVQGGPPPSVNLTSHVNGRPDVRTDCDACHGDPTRSPVVPACGTGICTDPLVRAAPPVTASGSPAGAHLAHVNPAALWTVPLRCAECHQGAVPPLSPTHMDGTPTVAFGGRATQGGAAASYDGVSCSATYCHGNYSGDFVYSYWDWGTDQLATTSVPYSGAHANPTWTGAPVTCGSCHGAPPPGAWHSPSHGSLAYQRECQTCHPDAGGPSAAPIITDPSLHVNGQLDVTPRWDTNCTNCH